jgi:Flp pilus assembly protein TadG
MRPARGKGCADDRGAAAVELAIVLPVMMLLIFGLIDFGRAMSQQIMLTEAVREGARVGALSGTTTDVKNQVTSILGSDFAVNNYTPTVCTIASSSTADSIVTVSHPYTALTPIFPVMALFGSNTTAITLTATGVMACVG